MGNVVRVSVHFERDNCFCYKIGDVFYGNGYKDYSETEALNLINGTIDKETYADVSDSAHCKPVAIYEIEL